MREKNASKVFAYLKGKGRTDSENPFPKVLIVYGSPLHNSFGDTAIATRHIDYLLAINSKIDITIWSGESDMWHLLTAHRVTVVPFVSPRELLSFDAIILDSADFGETAHGILSQYRGGLLSWPQRAGSATWKFRGETIAIKLGPFLNHSVRIGELYESLGLTRGKVDRPVRDSQRRSNVDRVFFNPFASTAKKSIPPILMREIVSAMMSSLPENSIIDIPVGYSDQTIDNQWKSELDSVTAWLAKVHVRRVHPVVARTTADYIRIINSASIAIAPDTSTQHICSLVDTPSLSIYPNDSGYHYMFWAPTEPHCVALVMPSDTKDFCIFGQLMASILKALTGEATFSPVIASQLMRATVRYEETITAYLNNLHQLSGKFPTTQAIKIKNLLPRDWRRFITKEISDFEKEVKNCSSDEMRQMAFKRLRSLNSLKIIKHLALH